MTPEQVRLAKKCTILETVIAGMEKYIRTDQNTDPVVLQCQYVPLALAEIGREDILFVRDTFVNYLLDSKRDYEESISAKVDRLRNMEPSPTTSSTPTSTTSEAVSDVTPTEVGKQKKLRKKAKSGGA